MPSGNIRIGDLDPHLPLPTPSSAAICRSCWTRPSARVEAHRLPPRHRRRRGRHRHRHRLRPRQRPARRLHPRDQAGRRLDARRRSNAREGSLPALRRPSCPDDIDDPLRVRPVRLRHQRASAAWSPKALLGAVLTGLMVLLFLRDWRSALIVVPNIPLALLGAVVACGSPGRRST